MVFVMGGVSDGIRLEHFELLQRFQKQRLEQCALYCVFADELPLDKLRINGDMHLFGFESQRCFKSGDEGAVFSLVVGAVSDVFGDLFENGAVMVFDDSADCGMARIPPASAIGQYK